MCGCVFPESCVRNFHDECVLEFNEKKALESLSIPSILNTYIRYINLTQTYTFILSKTQQFNDNVQRRFFGYCLFNKVYQYMS